MTVADVLEEEVLASSLRKAVVDINGARGHPQWALSETMEVCVHVDIIHEKREICSTSKLRENRNPTRCVRTWLHACEFDWPWQQD